MTKNDVRVKRPSLTIYDLIDQFENMAREINIFFHFLYQKQQQCNNNNNNTNENNKL